jgi:hypothetical protein
MKSRDGWFRSPRTAVLLLAALVILLSVGAAVAWVSDRSADAVYLDGEPMTDAQAAAQVVASAKQIVGSARLEEVSGGYTFVSCKNSNEPPYQVAAYMNFLLPQTNSATYLHEVAAEIVSHGWAAAPAMGEHFGQKLTKDGVTAIFYRSVNSPDFATMRLYGECRDIADHRNDNPAWIELTDQLG